MTTPAITFDDLAILRSLSDRGDKTAHLMIRLLDVLKPNGIPTITVAAVVSGHIDCTVQLRDVLGVELTSQAMFRVWVSDTAKAGPTSDTPTVTIPSGGAIILAAEVSGKVFSVISNSTGAAILRIADTGQTFYLNVAVADVLVASAAIVLP